MAGPLSHRVAERVPDAAAGAYHRLILVVGPPRIRDLDAVLELLDQDRLFGLKTCYALTRQDVDASPTCPHAPYRRVEQPAGPVLGALSAAEVLASLGEQLDELVRERTQTLLTNLGDPTVAENIELISDAGGKQAIRDFLASQELPDPVPPLFVKALQEALTGLEKVAVTGDGLWAALTQGTLHGRRAEAAIRPVRRGPDQGQERQEGPCGGGVMR